MFYPLSAKGGMAELVPAAGNLWLQIPMADSFQVEHLEPFQDLFGDLPCVLPCHVAVLLHVLTEIPIRDILHREKYVVLVFVPAKELHEQVTVLQDDTSISTQPQGPSIAAQCATKDVHLSR